MHDDFKKIPLFTFRFNRPLVGLINAYLAWDRFRKKSSRDPLVERRDARIHHLGGSSFEVTIMRPPGGRKPSPALLYYHGGAFALRHSSLHLQFCERYAREADCCVIAVDYRLGPSRPFPHGFDDCYRALEWVRDNASELRIDSKRIAVMGDSAGGAMAAGVAQCAHDSAVSLCAQVLVYPVLDSDCKTTSAREFSDTPLWNADSNRNMWKMYLRRVDRENPPPYASPAHREDLSHLPPAYVETAEFDPLRDEGIDYARRLALQGVPVKLNETSGTIHGYELAASNPETVRSLAERIAYLRERFDENAGGTPPAPRLET